MRRAGQSVGLLGLLALVALAVPLAAVGDEGPVTGDVIEAQARLVERVRDYRASLARLLALQDGAAERADAQVRRRRELLERDIVSRRELEESERLSQAARREVEETRRRMAETDALVGETLAAMELARTPRAADMQLVATPAVIGYQGAGGIAAGDLSRIENLFVVRFGRSLPVSALGQTAVHDRLGLDHRQAVDIAVHPDSEEGQALTEYLRLRRIPFLAFRKRIPGASTGAHLHVGPTSPYLVPVGAAGR